MPGAIAPGTPTVDLTKTGDSLFTNAFVDNVLGTQDGFIRATALLYANGRDLKDPLLSPIYGDVQGFPPAILTSGTRDLYLSNTVRMHRKLRAAGVEAVLQGYSVLALPRCRPKKRATSSWYFLGLRRADIGHVVHVGLAHPNSRTSSQACLLMSIRRDRRTSFEQMTALGHSRRFPDVRVTSAYAPRPTTKRTSREVAFVPKSCHYRCRRCRQK
jgi:hypothetical protein